MAKHNVSDSYIRIMQGGPAYQYGSHARAVYYDEPEPVYYDEQVPAYREELAPAYTPKAAPKAAPRKKSKPKRQFHLNTLKSTSVGTYLLMLTVAVCALGALFVQAMLYKGQMEVTELRASVRDTETANNALRGELYNKVDKDEIERRAREELGMVTPSEYQKVKIQAVRRGYVTLEGIEEQKPVKALEKILGHVQVKAGN